MLGIRGKGKRRPPQSQGEGIEMHNTRMVMFCLAALLAALAVGAEADVDDVDDAEEWKPVTIDGRTYYERPDEVARRLGMPRQDIPDDENAAYVYIRALDALEGWLPAIGEQVASDQYYAAMDGPWSAEDFPQLHARFVKTAEGRRLIRQAVRMDQCQFPVLVGSPGDTRLFEFLMPHLAGGRTMARLLAIEGHLLETQGDAQAALECHVTGLRIGAHFAHDPTLIAGLVGIAIQEICRENARLCVARMDVPGETLEWLAGELEDVELPGRAAWIAGERAMTRQMAAMSPVEVGEVFGRSSEVPGPARAFLGSRAFRILWPDRTLARDLDAFYDAAGKLAELPTWEALAAVSAGQDEVMIAEQAKDWNVMAWMLLPAIGGAQSRYALGECGHAALRIDVALRRYQADNGRYPAALTELAPKYLREVPPNPFCGEPFHYRLEDDGWTLYSVGLDQDDDGGREAVERLGLEEGDFVFRSHPEGKGVAP